MMALSWGLICGFGSPLYERSKIFVEDLCAIRKSTTSFETSQIIARFNQGAKNLAKKGSKNLCQFHGWSLHGCF